MANYKAVILGACWSTLNRLGVISTYYGREAALELREDVHTLLEPGMLITMEPMLVIPEGIPGAGGYREHDILLIHQDGSVENLTKFPLGPEHNIIGNHWSSNSDD